MSQPRVTLSRWREAGEWWKGETPREIHRYIASDGNLRQKIRILPSLFPQPVQILRPKTTKEKEIHIRRDKDEKVAQACGALEERFLGIPSRPSSKLDTDCDRSGVLLHALSGYAFGRGATITAEIPAYAAQRGYGAALLADPFSLAGAYEFFELSNEESIGIHPLIGASFEMADGGSLVLVARNKRGYRSLSRLISECHLEEPRLYPLCNWERLAKYTDDLLCLTGGDDGPVNQRLIRHDFEGAYRVIDRLVGFYGKANVFVQIEHTFLPWQIAVNRNLMELAERFGIVPVAGGPVLHAKRENFPTHDMLVCIETLCTIDEIEGRKLHRDPSQPQLRHAPRRSLNAERYIRTQNQNRFLYADNPTLLDNRWRVVERCEPNVLPLRTNLPRFDNNEEALFRELTWQSAYAKYGRLRTPLKNRIAYELGRITESGFTRHFLVAWDMCRWAREEGIMHSGRGSVVDSVIAYCLGMSRIDAFEHRLHFDRFLPEAKEKPKRPDIDIDFEAKRRDDVRAYLAHKYGDAHVATVCAFGTYGTRGIVREVGKVMGIPEEYVNYLTKRLHGSVTPERLEQALRDRPELRDSNIPKERFHWVFQLAAQMTDLPRNFRSHSSGVVISEVPIADTVPVMASAVDGVKIIQWDKRSAKRCFDKFDILCLRGNDVLGDTERHFRRHSPGLEIGDKPIKDGNTYRAMRAGELIGIPQSASPAMRQAHVRIQTEDLKDAGIVQAAIRPGVGGAVKIQEYVDNRKDPMLRWRQRLTHEKMHDILDHTLGIIVFQEQIDQLLTTFGNYSPDEAESIREQIYKLRKASHAERIKDDMYAKILGQGYSRAVADQVYEMVAQFQGYGFAQGHALAFAEISLRSIWCQQNFPAEYFAALFDAQPAGYYGPITIANEARNRGVVMLPPHINKSGLKFGIEDVLSNNDPKMLIPQGGIRTSLRQIGGISEGLRERIVAEREREPFASMFDFVARVEVNRDELERLILCGAFDSLFPNRRALLWAIPRAMEHAALARSMRGTLPLFMEDPPIPEGVQDFSYAIRAIHERTILGMDVDQHLMAYERTRIAAKGGITAAVASRTRPGNKMFVVGNPIRLRFPPTSSGKRVMFFDLEDETGLLNVTCFDDVYQRDGHQVICNRYITLWGETQDRDGHIAFLAHRILPYQPILEKDPNEPEIFVPVPVTVADFLVT